VGTAVSVLFGVGAGVGVADGRGVLVNVTARVRVGTAVPTPSGMWFMGADSVWLMLKKRAPAPAEPASSVQTISVLIGFMCNCNPLFSSERPIAFFTARPTRGSAAPIKALTRTTIQLSLDKLDSPHPRRISEVRKEKQK